ncbi:MAG: hypothetical protein ACO2ZM_08265 [Francisellaceae bacterium]
MNNKRQQPDHKLSYLMLFNKHAKSAAIRALIFILIFAIIYYVISGETLSPAAAVIFFLVDASIYTWRHRWFGKNP